PAASTSATGDAPGKRTHAASSAARPPGSAAARTCRARPVTVTRSGRYLRATYVSVENSAIGGTSARTPRYGCANSSAPPVWPGLRTTGRSAGHPASASERATGACEKVGSTTTAPSALAMAAFTSAVIRRGTASPSPRTPSYATPPPAMNGASVSAERFHSVTSCPASVSSATAAAPPAPAPRIDTFIAVSVCDQDALGLEDLPHFANVGLETRALVNTAPAARARDVDRQVEIDPAGPWGHDDHAVGEKHRLVDAVRDEQHRVAQTQPHRLQVHDHLFAGQRIERTERLVH